ncbi:DUF3099 domain-containing protein [Naasia sp. SYSU D00948]|uniref:DUF3099 domain-containing protein n=1 Tax=Naasia sp. SYSU D00948 TaxID=2817379 RepID=UPI001B316613|nr:DUF3099 domain-containing protein [Naasia sp. SYSU D00948]
MSKRTPTQSITTLPLSPQEERRSRMVKYSIAMGIRTLCVVSLLFVQGWWILVMVLAALVLPYFAVVVANVRSKPAARAVPVAPYAALPAPRFHDDGPAEHQRAS